MALYMQCDLSIVGGGPLVAVRQNGKPMLRHADFQKYGAIGVCDLDDTHIYHHVTGLHGDQKDAKGRLRGNHNGDFMWWKRTLLAQRGDGLYAYETWRGGDVYENHDEERPFGYIPDVWPDFKRKAIDMLMATSRKGNPKLAANLENGRITDVSMGAIVGHSYCMIPGCFRSAEFKNPNITEDDYCEHLRHLKGQFLAPEQAWVGEDNRDVFGVEVSWITMGVGADPTAIMHRTIQAREAVTAAQHSHKGHPMNTPVADLYDTYLRSR